MRAVAPKEKRNMKRTLIIPGSSPAEEFPRTQSIDSKGKDIPVIGRGGP
jgi:hypothetical protein